MQVILTEEEYQALKQKIGQVEAQVEIKLEEEKKKLKERLLEECKIRGYRTPSEVIQGLIEILKHY